MKEIEQIMMQRWINAQIYKYNIQIKNIDMNRAKQMRLNQFVILFKKQLTNPPPQPKPPLTL